MKCPYCQQIIALKWLPMWVMHGAAGEVLGRSIEGIGYIVDDKDAVAAICSDAGVPVPHERQLGDGVGLRATVGWMKCPNSACQQLLIHASRALYNPFRNANDLFLEERVVFPHRPATRAIDPLVPHVFAEPFKQAWLILDDSPGMSAVLSRKILADLLEQKGGYKGYTVKEQIDKFIEDPQQPSTLKENLHVLREMANFAAHTQTDQTTGEILQTTREEAEWTLDNIERLFDHFIVNPARIKLNGRKWHKRCSRPAANRSLRSIPPHPPHSSLGYRPPAPEAILARRPLPALVGLT